MDSKEFVKKALRTESNDGSNELDVDLHILRSTLRCIDLLCDSLDSIKKKVYYGDSDKYDRVYLENLKKCNHILNTIPEHFNNAEYLTQANMAPVVKTNKRLAHAIIGCITEAGELAEAMVKGLDDGQYDETNIAEEFFDQDWYKAIMSDELDIDWEDQWERIIKKLEIRFPDLCFDKNKVKNRNLNQEREALEHEK